MPRRVPLDPDLYADVVAEAQARFAVWPSAYASGWVVRTYKQRGGRYAGEARGEDTGLTKWFGEEWVDLSRPIYDEDGDLVGYEPCGRKKSTPQFSTRDYPKCRPVDEALAMTPAEVASAIRRKRAAEAKASPERGRKPVRVATYRNNPHAGPPFVKANLDSLLDRTGKTEEILTSLADIYAERARAPEYDHSVEQMQQTEEALRSAAQMVEDVWEGGYRRNPDVCYHVTSFASVDSIAANGLRPRRGAGVYSHGGYGEHSQGKVFLAGDKDAALAWYGKIQDMLWHEHSDDEEPDELVPVMLRIDLSLTTLQEEVDPLGDRDVPGSYFVADVIPPDAIEFFDPSTKEWTPIEDWSADAYDGVESIEYFNDEGDVVDEDDTDEYGEQAWTSRGFTVYGPYDDGGFKPSMDADGDW